MFKKITLTFISVIFVVSALFAFQSIDPDDPPEQTCNPWISVTATGGGPTGVSWKCSYGGVSCDPEWIDVQLNFFYWDPGTHAWCEFLVISGGIDSGWEQGVLFPWGAPNIAMKCWGFIECKHCGHNDDDEESYIP